jgi:hypothetical protein
MDDLEKVLLRTRMEQAYCDSVLNTGIVFFSVKFWVRRELEEVKAPQNGNLLEGESHILI